MDFHLSDEQVLLRDSATRYIQEQCAFDRWLRWKLEGRQPAWDLWPAFADMGWLSLPFASADGGLDGGPLETMLLVEALGRGLVAEPYVQSVVQAGEVLKRSEPGAQRTSRIQALAQGRLRIAMACDEQASRYERDLVRCTAEPAGPGWRLNGHKAVVLAAPVADAFIVSAGTPAGHTLFWVDAGTAGLKRKDYPLVDGGLGSDLLLEQVLVADDARLCAAGRAADLLGPATDATLAAIGAEALGLTDLLLAQTLAYTQERRQFGQSLSQFQALRHRMVDMFMQVEQLRSTVILATVRLKEQHADLPRSLSALKVQVGKVGRFVSQQAVQLHGGMGMTDEIVVGHAFKRLLSLDAQLGNVDHHLTRFAALSA